MRLVNIFTLLLLISFSNVASSKLRADVGYDTKTVSVQDTGRDLADLLRPGTIIGDCIVTNAKFYSAKEFVIQVKKTNGNILSKQLNAINSFQIVNPSWYSSNNSTMKIKNIVKYENMFSVQFRELQVKAVRLNNGATKVTELIIISTNSNDQWERTFNEKNSISCISKKR